MVGDGISNWVSTIETDNNGGENWVQAGWELIPWWDTTPHEYIEDCVHYTDATHSCSGYYHKWDTLTQPWGNQYEYWVYQRNVDGILKWCGVAGPTGYVYEWFCYPVHAGAAPITVRSEFYMMIQMHYLLLLSGLDISKLLAGRGPFFLLFQIY